MNTFFKSLKISKGDVIFLLLLSVCTICVYANTSASSNFSSDLPFSGPLEKFMSFIQGPFAYAVAVIGIVALATALVFGGEMGEFVKRALYSIVAIGFIVGAVKLVSFVQSSANVLPENVDLNVLQALVNTAI